MLHVHLQNTLGLQGEVWLHGGEVLLHFEGHALAAGEADGMGLQLAGGLHLIHPASQRLLQEIQRLLMIRRLRLLLVPQLQIAVHGGAECLVAVGAEDIGDELVGLIGEVQDLHAAVLQQLRLGQMIHRLHAVAGGVIDILLLLRHPGNVLTQRHQLLLGGGVEQQQILQLLLHGAVVVQGAELQLAAEAAVELLIALPVVLQHPLQLAADLLLQIVGDDLQLAVVLQQLTGDIQAQVRGVHHATDKVEALRQQIGALIHDHHAAGIQLQARLEVLGIVLAGGLGGNEQQGLISDGALRRDGDHRLRRSEIPEVLLIELVVLLPCDLALLPLPQGNHAVEGLPLPDLLILRLVLRTALLALGAGHFHTDGEADIVGVLLHQTLEGVLLQVLAVLLRLLVGLQVHDDIRTHSVLPAGFDGIALHAIGLPAPALLIAVLPGDDGDVVGHHEGRVEAHTELADNVALGILIQLLTELEGTAGGDDAQILLQIGIVHADAVVADGEGAGLLIGADGDGKILPLHAHLLIRQGAVAQLVDGVGGVGQDLPQEDLLMGVDGVDHQLQQTLGLRLKFFSFHS